MKGMHWDISKQKINLRLAASGWLRGLQNDAKYSQNSGRSESLPPGFSEQGWRGRETKLASPKSSFPAAPSLLCGGLVSPFHSQRGKWPLKYKKEGTCPQTADLVSLA